MVNQAVNMILEDLLDRIFIKPTSAKQHIIKNNTHTHSSHIWDDTDSNYILQLNERIIKLNTVVHLDLSKCNLHSIPDSLCNLPLKSLNLSHNFLHFVPNCIFLGLDLIENLNLSYNSITEFEKEPRCLIHIEILNLAYNKIKYIPIWFVHAKCRKLKELYYTNNILGKTNESLYNKVHLYDIKKIILRNSHILNENINFIKSIHTVEILDISNDTGLHNKNSLTNYDDLFNEPTWKNNINVLNISNLTMGFLPNDILSLISLRELYLSKNTIFWLPECIGNMVNLEILDLYENELDSCNLKLCKYKYLDLERNFFDTTVLDTLYIERRENYRTDFNLKCRILGYYQEDLELISDASDEEVVRDNHSEEESNNSNTTPNSFYEEEWWEDEKIKADPDITPSDDEWQGYSPILQSKKSSKENLNHLLEMLYEDVD